METLHFPVNGDIMEPVPFFIGNEEPEGMMTTIKISQVDALITQAITAGEFPDEDAAAEALHEWLLHHKQIHNIDAIDLQKLTAAPKADSDESAGNVDDAKYQLEVMRNQDA